MTFRRRAEINRRQRNDHDNLSDGVPKHGLAPAEPCDDALKQRRPHCAGQVTAARNQRQGRATPSVEPATDIDVHRRVDAPEPDQADEQPVPDPQRPARAECRDRETEPDHQRAKDHGPPCADLVGDPSHQDAAETGTEPGQRTGESRNRTHPVNLGGDVLECDRRDPRGAERHQHRDERGGGHGPGGFGFDRR